MAVIRALLFDFDGVIVDTEVPTYESWRHVYAEYGVDLALSDWVPVVGSGTSTAPGAVFDAVAHLERLIGRRLDRDAIIARRSQRKLEMCDRAELLPGVLDYLADARRLRLKTAIVTRGSEEWFGITSRACVSITHGTSSSAPMALTAGRSPSSI